MNDVNFNSAFKEYKKGNYAKAYEIYNQLGDLLGKGVVAANVYLCEKKLKKKLPFNNNSIKKIFLSNSKQSLLWMRYLKSAGSMNLNLFLL